jgi:hypothetical protein
MTMVVVMTPRQPGFSRTSRGALALHISTGEAPPLEALAAETLAELPPSQSFNYPTKEDLRNNVRAFAYKKGFQVTTQVTALFCLKAAEPKSYTNQRDKRENGRKTTNPRYCSWRSTRRLRLSLKMVEEMEAHSVL